jgi:hypothetical protein
MADVEKCMADVEKFEITPVESGLVSDAVYASVSTFVETYNQNVGSCVTAFTQIQAALDE